MTPICYKSKRPPKWLIGNPVTKYEEVFDENVKRFAHIYGDTVNDISIVPAWWIRDIWSPTMLRAAIRGHRLYIAYRNPFETR